MTTPDDDRGLIEEVHSYTLGGATLRGSRMLPLLSALVAALEAREGAAELLKRWQDAALDHYTPGWAFDPTNPELMIGNIAREAFPAAPTNPPTSSESSPAPPPAATGDEALLDAAMAISQLHLYGVPAEVADPLTVMYAALRQRGEELALSEVALRHTKGLLASAEKALEARDARVTELVAALATATAHKAEFLWPCDEGSVEEAGYEFRNGTNEGYLKLWWDTLLERASAAATARAEAAEVDAAQLRRDFPPAPPLPIIDCECGACQRLRQKQIERVRSDRKF